QHIAKFAVFDGIKWTTVESNSTIPDDSWTHLTARFNKTAIEIYVNGTLEGTVNHDGVLYVTERGRIELKTVQEITSYKDIVIGASITADMASTAYNMFSGLIDGVELFDHKLEPEDVYLIYQQSIPILAPPPAPVPVSKPQAALRYRILNTTRTDEELPVSISAEKLNKNLDQITVSAWIRPNYTNGSPEFAIVSKERSFILSLNKMLTPEKIAKFSIYDGISWHTVSGSTPINGWTHLAGVFNNSTLILYVNGTIDGRLDRGPPETAGSLANVTIGAYQTTARGHDRTTNYFSGDLGEVTIYPNLLIEPEIHSMFLNYVLEFTQEPGSITAFTIFDSINAVDDTGILVDTPKPADNTPSLPDGLGFSDKITLLVNHQTVPIEQPVVLGNSTNVSENLGLTDKITILLNNQTVNLLGITNRSSTLTHSEIEIGQMVNWTQNVMVNDPDA
ncbi:hypothetical protein LCGC14_2655850, partial [marine sediment metagenome]